MCTVRYVNTEATKHHSTWDFSPNHKWELLFPSLLLSLISFFQITVGINYIKPFGEELTGKTKKAAAGKASSYLSISTCHCLPLPHLIPLCVPLVTRQSCGSLWNLICISKKRSLHSLSPALLLYRFSVATLHLVLLSSSCFFPSCLHLSLHTNPSSSAPPSASHLHIFQGSYQTCLSNMDLNSALPC